jgi:hypothetical protein
MYENLKVIKIYIYKNKIKNIQTYNIIIYNFLLFFQFKYIQSIGLMVNNMFFLLKSHTFKSKGDYDMYTLVDFTSQK